MLNRIVIIGFILMYQNVAFAFDFGSFVKNISTQKATTPIGKVREAMSDVDNNVFRDSVNLTAEDSVAFPGFTAVFVDGVFEILTNTNMDGEEHVVIYPVLYSNEPRKMYIKHGEKWSKADEKTFIDYINTELIPVINTQYFKKVGGNEAPKALVIEGSRCGSSQRMEGLLEAQNISHYVMPMSYQDSANSDIAIACAQVSTWSDWSKGKPVKFKECDEMAGYDKFVAQAKPVLTSLRGFTDTGGFPYVIMQNGDTYLGDPGNEKSKIQFLDRINESQKSIGQNSAHEAR